MNSETTNMKMMHGHVTLMSDVLIFKTNRKNNKFIYLGEKYRYHHLWFEFKNNL